MESVHDTQLQTIEAQKTADVQNAFDLLFNHANGVPSGWFNASQIASSMSPEECSKLEGKSKLVDDLIARGNLAQRKVWVLHGNRKTSSEASQAYKSAKERLKQLTFVKDFFVYGFNMPNEAFTKLIQQADNGVEHVNYDDEKAELINRQVKDTLGEHCEAITAPSTDPNVIAIEKSIKEEFGVKVNFGDNLNLAQQTYEVCGKVKSFGHKFPDEIILFKTSKEYVKGVTIRRKAYTCIIIANVDPGDRANTLCAGASFKSTLFHEFGHVNSKIYLHLYPNQFSEFSKGLTEHFSTAVKEFVSTLPDTEDVLQKLESAIAKNAGVPEIEDICCAKLAKEDIAVLLDTVTKKMNKFVDQTEDCFGKRVAKEVSIYAATSELEFMAEVYCGLMLGKSYSQEIMDEYKKLGGRPLA
jgi:hypothetical protein